MEAFLGLVGVDAGLKAWTNCVSLFCCTKRMSCDAGTRASVRDASELRELRVEQLAIGKKQELRTLLDDIMSAAKVPREVPPHDEVSFHEEVTRAVEAVRKTERVDAKEKGWNGWRSGNDCANDICYQSGMALRGVARSSGGLACVSILTVLCSTGSKIDVFMSMRTLQVHPRCLQFHSPRNPSMFATDQMLCSTRVGYQI